MNVVVDIVQVCMIVQLLSFLELVLLVVVGPLDMIVSQVSELSCL